MGARFVCPAKPLSDWSTHELERGLESLGFTQYSRPLRAAGISGRVLSELAEGGGLFDGLFDDLRVSESHRIWLRSALQALPAAIALAQRTSTSYQPTAASPPHSAHSVVAHTSPKLKRPRLRRADSSADRAMMELDHFLRPHKQRVEDEWTRQLRDMEYPQKRTDVERATRSPGGNSERVKGPRQPIARGLRRTRSFQPAERIDEAILENFRHRDAHLLTEGVYFFVTHRHHRGRLRDSIKDVVHSRYVAWLVRTFSIYPCNSSMVQCFIFQPVRLVQVFQIGAQAVRNQERHLNFPVGCVGNMPGPRPYNVACAKNRACRGLAN